MIKVSCVCPTHGRPWLLEEAVESFRRQAYGNYEAELLIINDCPEQQLHCSLPGVRIVNMKEPVTDLSDKFNLSVHFAQGDLICWWEDDDISFPSRINDCLLHIGNHDAYKQGKAFCQQGDSITHDANMFFGNVCFRKEAWTRCGGSVHGEAADLSAWLAICKGDVLVDTPLPQDTHFLYRWGGTGAHHDSAVAGTNKDRFLAFRERTLAHPLFTTGRIELAPRWHGEYVAMCMNAWGGGAR